MKRHELQLARPLYESLPWIYILCGLLALVASYLNDSAVVSAVAGALGVVCLLGGLVLLLRRRDYRELRARYDKPSPLEESRRD